MVTTIRVTFDEELLREFDQCPDVRSRGRSAVLRDLVTNYLTTERSEDIARQCREGYTKYPQTDEDLAWARIEAWSDDQG